MILKLLKSALPDDVVIAGPGSDPRYHRDWTASEPVVPVAVVTPRNAEEVSIALKLCNQEEIPVVPQGGMTGLVGGAMPLADAVVINMSKLTFPIEIDTVSNTATVGAGTVLQTLQEAAAEAGLLFPVDFGARGSCQIGGMIATNAGGIQVLRYGMIRSQVLGLEAVLADGTIVSSMNPLVKNNTGYDLRQLFTGSEGTLGIITRVILRLVPAPSSRAVALVRVGSVDAAFALLANMRREGVELNAFEAMWPNYYAFACSVAEAEPLPCGAGLTLLIETVGEDAENLHSNLENSLGRELQNGLLEDAVISRSEKQAETFWKIREANESLPSRFSSIIGFDISLPAKNIREFMDANYQMLQRKYPNANLLCFGHIGDCNLHLAVASNEGEEFDHSWIKGTVLGLTGEFGGAISAEHGIGADKLEFLNLTRSQSEIDLMLKIKRALDPQGILNPDKLFPSFSTHKKPSPSESVA